MYLSNFKDKSPVKGGLLWGGGGGGAYPVRNQTKNRLLKLGLRILR